MEVSSELVLRELHIDPMEKFMDEYAGTVTELRCLFLKNTHFNSSGLKPSTNNMQHGSRIF